MQNHNCLLSLYMDILFLEFKNTSQKLKWKGTIMLRTFARFARFIRDYRYYRERGLNSKAAWNHASMTLP